MKRKHIKVFGMVQGVGFRYYTQKIARKYHIVGNVNLKMITLPTKELRE